MRIGANTFYKRILLTNNQRMGLKERLLWEHSIGTAFGCRLLVQEHCPQLAEEAFLAGLMHDIGKLVLNQHAGDQFNEIVQIVYNENRMFAETEQELLGFDHTEVGALLIKKWKLSPLLEAVISDHHNEAAFTPDNVLLLFLDLANNLCKRQGIGFVENPTLELVETTSNKILKIPSETLDSIAQKLQHTLESEMEIFV